ncbi:MAG: hypothetical protein HGB31_08030 [Erysipelotrichaceae bacterium]|nr:hypothetical protein [Erysipelotrichaceae bacterium]
MSVHANSSESWKVKIVDTGLTTMIGDHVKRIANYVGDEPFFQLMKMVWQMLIMSNC